MLTNHMRRIVSLLTRRCLLVAASCLFFNASFAQNPAVGTVEGRVFNPATGGYLETVRVTVEGTAIETFTDSAGHYRLTNVPAGTAKIRLFRTGIMPQTVSVSVEPGGVVQHDLTMSALQTKAESRDAIVLDQFVVSDSKQMDEAAIAINTQRFAPNVMNVVTGDEFGAVADGGVGEVLKSLPGISIWRGGFGDAYEVSMNGVPAANVPVTVGGFNVADATRGTGRSVGIHMFSLNSFSRIEVVHTPTPESSGSALAGSVNMVPRSAFERSTPQYNFSLAMVMRDNNRSLHKTPGPRREPSYKIHPGINFSAVVPVNKRFGFTVSASASSLYTDTNFMQNTWRGAGSATNGTTLPDTTPDNPYLSEYLVRDGAILSKRRTLATTIDYQLSRNDRLSFSYHYGFADHLTSDRNLTLFVNRVLPGEFSTNYTHGYAGAGEVRRVNSVRKGGGGAHTPSFSYRHSGPIWTAELGASFSKAERYLKSTSRGFFNNSQAHRQGVTVSFDDIFYLRPRRIGISDGGTGAAVDPYDLSTSLLNTATDNESVNWAVERSAMASMKRHLHWRFPLTVKAGFDVRHSMKDIRGDNPTFTFVGADGLAGTADDTANAVLDASFSRRTAPFGFPQIQWVSNESLWELQQAKPSYFTANDSARYTQQVSLSKHAEEVVSSGYFRGDAHFRGGRLKVVGGVRVEQTNVKGEGRLIDATRNFQRNASNTVILGPNGQPLPITTNALQAAQLTNVDRGMKAEKEYLRWFPSINVSLNIRENLIGRFGYYWSVGRPDFNQYAGGLTLPNTENPPGPGNRIVVNNAGIKAWSAKTAKVALEYYFHGVGMFSVAAFQRNFENFFGNAVFEPTPDFLKLYGLNPEIYGDYEVSTQQNLASPVRMTGIDFNYKQALTFLPRWGQGVQVFANASSQRAIGEPAANFAGYVPFMANWGIGLSRPKYSLRLNWNYNGRARGAMVAAGRSIEPGTYNWNSKRLVVDLNGEYFFYKRFAAFTNFSNLGDAPTDVEIAGPGTPAHAQLRQRRHVGALWTFGVKGTF